MKTTVGIFTSRAEAERAAENLRSIGIARDKVNVISPGASEQQVGQVRTTETEQPGMGKALGGVVGGAIGAAGGMSLGAAAASLLVPGVGPVIATGLAAAALLGVGGAVGGAAAGEALETGIADGLPKDELYVYEDALRQGRTVVAALVEDEEQAERARDALARAGAETLDSARENWWVGLRDAEEEEYTRAGRSFKSDEPHYRRGFESALHPEARNKSYTEAAGFLRDRHADAYGEESFRRGFERGQNYYRSLREKYRG